jgi:hypothetical protein
MTRRKDVNVKLILNQAKTRAGHGWHILGPDLRRALVCEALVNVVMSKDHEKYADLQELIGASIRALDPPDHT